MRTILEVCVDTAEGILACEEGGADCIELCSALSLGGLTPSYGLMEVAARSRLHVRAMIRPRAGSFVFTDAEITMMERDIQVARDLGLSGVVLGASTPDGELDFTALKGLLEIARDMDVTLHRVVDILDDPLKAVRHAIDLGFNRILTSGASLHAIDGIEIIEQMQQLAGEEIEIMAGSGVTASNARAILERTGISAIHASCSSHMPMGARYVEFGFSDKSSKFTDVKAIKALKSAI